MKKLALHWKILIGMIVGILFGLGMAEASEKRVFDDVGRRFRPVDYRNAEPIVFMERGIEFYVFPNGEFDFNTVRTATPNRPRGNSFNSTFGAPNVHSYNNHRNNGVRIEHDHFGRVRRIGNVFINYDAFGRIRRAGSVYMRYNSFALTQVGNLRIVYNRRGQIISVYGTVNGFNHGYVYNPGGFGGNTYYNTNVFNNDDFEGDFYYYRTDGTKAKMAEEDVNKIEREATSLRNRR
jgi:hypothetical protein